MNQLDWIAWVDWWLCGGEWNSAASRWRYQPDFDQRLHELIGKEK